MHEEEWHLPRSTQTRTAQKREGLFCGVTADSSIPFADTSSKICPIVSGSLRHKDNALINQAADEIVSTLHVNDFMVPVEYGLLQLTRNITKLLIHATLRWRMAVSRTVMTSHCISNTRAFFVEVL